MSESPQSVPPYEHPIAAVATATPGAIAVVRCSGAGCIPMVATVFDHPGRLHDAAGNTIRHGRLLGSDGRIVDEVLVAVYRGPESYTGEDVVEVFCHGSTAGTRAVLGALLATGFAPAEPGEFTRRAFLNGKLDLTRAEAVNEVVRAHTTHAHALAVDRLNGSVAGVVGGLRTRLIGVLAQVAAQLDYPEEDTPDASIDREEIERLETEISSLARTYETGRIFQEGVRVAVAGRTNAGKSSLFNQILRQDRSIVSEVHGTTRDYIEAMVDIRGIPVRLYDTAGLRTASEGIEEEGIRRTRTIVASSDLVLYVVAADIGMVAEDEERITGIETHSPCVVVWNKTDLASDVNGPPDSVSVCSLSGEGIETLNAAIERHLLGSQPRAEVVIDSVRQYDLLLRAAEALRNAAATVAEGIAVDAVAVDLQDALDAIGEITGEVATAEILDAMFSAFCVGK